MTTFNGMQGRWFSGSKTYSDSVPAVFLPVINGGSSGDYWSSSAYYGSSAYYLFFNGSSVNVSNNDRSSAYSVRCLKN